MFFSPWTKNVSHIRRATITYLCFRTIGRAHCTVHLDWLTVSTGGYYYWMIGKRFMHTRVYIPLRCITVILIYEGGLWPSFSPVKPRPPLWLETWWKQSRSVLIRTPWRKIKLRGKSVWPVIPAIRGRLWIGPTASPCPVMYYRVATYLLDEIETALAHAHGHAFKWSMARGDRQNILLSFDIKQGAILSWV